MKAGEHKSTKTNTLANEVYRYLVCGAIAALITLSVRILFSLEMPFKASTFCAQIVGMIVGYYLYRYFVWPKTTRSLSSSLVPFIIVNLLNLAVVLFVSFTLRALLARFFGTSEVVDTFAHATGIAFGAGLSLVGHRTFSFR